MYEDTNQEDMQILNSDYELYNPKRSIFYIIVLTLIIGALQLAWSTEFSEATPFLLSLGISKHVLALVWLAGPLSGSIGQPIVGLLSDRCNLTMGRRRIFILIGCLATVTSLLYMSHSTSIISFFLPPNSSQDKINYYTIPFACLGVYILDFSIAVIQASSRALIVDVVPTSQQQSANAWAARMIGIFNIIGFWLGSLDLTSLFPVLGDSQFKVLSILVSIVMTFLTLYCCYYIKERNPRTDITLIMQKRKQELKLIEWGVDPEKQISIWLQLQLFFKQILHSFKMIPKQVKIVCYAELFAWIGYFPLLFYTTSYVGELYLLEKGYPNPRLIPPDLKLKLIDESTRRGSIALLANAVVTLTVDLFLPIFVEKLTFKSRYYKWFNLKKLWIYSHIIFIISTLSTFFICNSFQAVILFAFMGIPWGCAVWIPFVIISEEISRIKDIKTIQMSFSLERETEGNHISDDLNKLKIYLKPTLVDLYNKVEHDSGILLAIHNVFVSAPQMISSLASSILFSLFKTKPDDSSFDTSLGWVFRFGGLMCIGAWILSSKVKTNEELYDDDKLHLSTTDF